MKAILKIDNKEIEVEISEEQIEKMTEKKKSPFERVKGSEFYFISAEGYIDVDIDVMSNADANLFGVANYCTDKDLLRQQAWRETLNRLLWRWQYENDEPVNWEKPTDKFHIVFDVKFNTFCCDSGTYVKRAFVNFSSKEKAEQAIEEVVKPFMAEHPDFVW